VDRVYKDGIPSARKALEKLKQKFSGFDSRTDWTKLRIDPLLDHTRSLERLLRSPKFSRETSRLTRGVVMFHSDLVYLQENVKALKTILQSERKPHLPKPRFPGGRRRRQAPKGHRGIAAREPARGRM
jgi:hypothetical protein